MLSDKRFSKSCSENTENVLLMLLPRRIIKLSLLHFASTPPDCVIITGKMLMGEGAAISVGDRSGDTEFIL